MSRPTHRVSAKIALYNPGRTSVVLAEYIKESFGLPGGHLEGNETPEEAIFREVKEELGFVLDMDTVTRKDFWRSPDGRIILGFISTIPNDQSIEVDTNEIADAKWVKISDIVEGRISAGAYDDFIVKNAE